MAIITLSRGTFGGGERLAALVAEKLGYRAISREQLQERVTEVYGISSDRLRQMFEAAPQLFDRAARDSQRLMVALQACLCELLGEDRVIYHGWVGNVFLAGIDHLLKLRLIAPRQMRVGIVMQQRSCTEADASLHIDTVDAARARWTRYFYGSDWTDAALYDMVLNLEWCTIEDLAELVAAATRLPSFQPTEASRARLRDVGLTSRVRARLMTHQSTADFLLDVKAENGHVRVSGLSDRGHISLVTEVVKSVPGVEDVDVVSLAWR
jgi:cytidylate kinase